MEQPDTKKPHWAWPHVIGVLIAIVAYYVIFRFTGDADIFYAIAMGGVGWAAAWTYFFPPGFLRRK
jgi:hypothetical protein